MFSGRSRSILVTNSQSNMATSFTNVRKGDGLGDTCSQDGLEKQYWYGNRGGRLAGKYSTSILCADMWELCVV